MTEKSRSRGPYAKTAARRAAVAAAALEVVLEKGHRALTTAEVAARAGLSERAMLYHFPTRDHLLVAAMEAQDDANSQLVDLGTGDEGHDPLEALPRRIAKNGMANPEALRLFGYLTAAAQDPESPAREYLSAHNARGIAGLTRLVVSRQARGLAHPDLDAASVARQMLAAWNGLQNQWMVEPSFDLAEEVAQAFRRLTGQPAMEARAMLDDILTRI